MNIQSNIPGKRLQDKNRSTTSKLAEATRRLASGYRINSAADDAAGLAISEKLRGIDRGLRQGQRNLSDGLNYADTVDGSSQEIHNILHRMKEIAVEAANGTYSQIDRDALDCEYQQLIDEIGQITDTSHFNGLPLFEKHQPEYEEVSGNVVHSKPVRITSENDTLVVGYTIGNEPKECTVSIPHGEYSADEIADLIDTELFNSAPCLIIGVNSEKQFTMQVEGGKLEYISGSASSLYYNTIIGSSEGYLLGVTQFRTDESKLNIVEGKNDVMCFRVGNTDDTLYSIKLDAGAHTRPEIIDMINRKIVEQGIPGDVRAVAEFNDEGNRIIGLASKEAITGLSGNFIMMDSYHSPIYDIAMHGSIDNTAAVLTGKRYLTASTEIERGRNDYFVLDTKYYDNSGNPASKQVKVNLLDDGENIKSYSPAELITRINEQLEAADVPITAELNSSGGISISSEQFGKSCDIRLNKSLVPSQFMVYDLFDDGTLSKVGPSRSSSYYTPASLTSNKQLENSIYIPADENTLTFNIDFDSSSGFTDGEISIDLISGIYDKSTLQTELNRALAAAYPDLADKLTFSVGTSIVFSAAGTNGSMVNKITAVTSASAYNRLIGGIKYADNYSITNGNELTYSSFSDINATTNRPTVSFSSGITTDGIKYYDDYSSTPQQSGNYLNYSTSTFSSKQGTETIIEIEGKVGWEEIITTPAELKLENVLTMFNAAGKSLIDTDLSFKLSDENGVETAYNITIPAGKTAADAISIIKAATDGKVNVSSSGSTLNLVSTAQGKNVAFSGVGGTLIRTASKNPLANRSGAIIDEGANKVYIPAKTTLNSVNTHIPYIADGNSDRLIFTAGAHSYDLRLTHGTYNTIEELAAEINAQISAKDGGSPATEVAVGTNGKSLVFTGPLAESGYVTINNLSTCLIAKRKETIDPASDPNYNPVTGKIETPATLRTDGIDSHFPKTVDSSSNTVTMDYYYPDSVIPGKVNREQLTITIPDGTYTNASQLTDAINAAITADPALNGKIKASYSSGGSSQGLTFTTVNGGDGYSLQNLGGTANLHKYLHKIDPSGGVVDPDANTVRYPAIITNNRFSTLFNGTGMEVTDRNNHVSLVISGTEYNFTLANGTYVGSSGMNDILNQLNAGLAAADVTISTSGGLTITTNGGGSDKTFAIGGSNTSLIFKKADSVSEPKSVSKADGRCRIVGKNPINTIEISSFNNKMEFDYSDNGTSFKFQVAVPEGTYTAQQLAEKIQESIDLTLPNALTVFVNSDKTIGIQGANASTTRSFSNFSGKLFDKVFQNANYYSVRTHTEKTGTSDGSYVTYIVGRNTLQPESEEELENDVPVIIYPGLNDGLTFDFTINGDTYEVSFTIPAGEYEPETLADTIQTEGRKALSRMSDVDGNPLPSESFYASIGLSRLGIEENMTAISSSDKLVLCFKLPDDGMTENMTAIIDGVRGNSAYRVFYDATRSPEPSKVLGKADLSNGVSILAGVNDTLSLTIDGVEQTVQLPEGNYTCKEVSDMLNEQYEAMGSLVRTVERNGHLMFYTTENGSYEIGRFSGNAANTLFYGGTERDDDTEIGIHTGRRTDSYIWYMKTRVDEHLMRINTTGVTSMERALKAIDRLDNANTFLSGWRALSGANVNRTEHTLERVTNYRQQLNAAESQIRDADIPSEVAAMAKQQLLMQVQQSMQQQNSQQQKSILDILA